MKYMIKKTVLNEINKFDYQPKISIILPTYNPNEKFFTICIESVLNQYYQIGNYVFPMIILKMKSHEK